MFRLNTVSIAVVSSLYIATAQALPSNALPTGGQVTQGQANIQQSANQMQINQNSQKAVINWNSFNIGKDASVQFQQPNAQSSTLNRVANGSSEIAGQLKANGQVYLLNPNGVLFSPTAQVNTGSLVVATGNLSDEEFLQGKGTLHNSANGKIINQGNLTAAQGGQIVLTSQQIENTGTITAEQGQVQLLAGQNVRVNVTADGLIQTELQSSGAGNGKIANSGTISANAGQVDLLATGQNSQIQHTGVIEAQSILEKDGKIYLIAGYEGDGVAPKTGTTLIDGRLDASAPNGGNGGFIETSAGQVQITDNAKVTTKAVQGKTGTWLIDPTDFTISAGSAVQTASGIGATTLENSLDGTSVEIQTSSTGTEQGNIYVNADVMWSQNNLTLTAHNDILVNAEMNVNGLGTLVLNTGTSGAVKMNLTDTGFTGRINFAQSGDDLLTINGEAYRIINELGVESGFGSGLDTDLQSIAGSTGVAYALGGNIDASVTATWNSGQGFNPLTLYSRFNGLGHEITNLTINRPTNDGALFGNISSMVTIDNLGLVNPNITGYQNVGALVSVAPTQTSFTNNYIGGGVVYQNASSGSVGGLVGFLNGYISNSYSTAQVIGYEAIGGLIGQADIFAEVKDSYATGNVTGLVGSMYVGGLIGYNTSQFTTNTHATGQVKGVDYVGGLIGYNRSQFTTNTHATGQVDGINYVGGLIGWSFGSAKDSYATGNVIGETYVGGLVGNSGSMMTAGWNIGSIYNSYATGDVTGQDYVGGLAGRVNGEVKESYATGIVTGRNNIGGSVGQMLYGLFENNYAIGNVISNSTNNTDANVGGLIGHSAIDQHFSILNSYAQGSVTATNGGAVGGLIGRNSGHIQDSHATGTVIGAEVVGGLAGFNEGTIINSYHITGTVQGVNRVGGLVGYNQATNGSTATITESWATGDVTGVVTGSLTGDFDISDSIGGLVGENDGTIQQSHATGKVTGRSDTGGLVGANTANGIIEQSYATGSVEGLVFVENTDSNAGATGGLVGFNDGRITTSYATGEVTGWRGVGGLAGSSAADNSADSSALAVIENSYATGNISGELGIGGLVGYLHASNGAVATIDQVYATGAVTASNGQVGGLVGINEEGSVSNAYWDTQNTGQSNAIGENTGTINNVTGISTAQMQQLASFSNWGTDISANGGENAVWRIYEGHTAPLLRNFMQGATLTVDANLQKVYDGNVDGATGTHTLVDVNGVVISQTPPDILGTANYVYASKNVGTHAVIENGLYSHQQGYDIQVVGGQGTITPRPLDGGVNVADYQRVYDGTTNISSSFYLNNVVLGDDVNIDGFLAFVDKHVGTAKPIQSDHQIFGADIANYDIALVQANIDTTVLDIATSNVITAAPLTITTDGINKTYDQTTNAAGTAVIIAGQLFDNDSLTGANFTYDNKNVGSNKTVTVSNAVIVDGNAGNNYAVTYVNNTTSQITPATLKALVSADNKVYDGNSNAVLQVIGDDRILGDDLTLTASGRFDSKNVGIGKVVTVDGITIAGADAANYVLDPIAATTTADISAATINPNLSITANNKVYDGTQDATLNIGAVQLNGMVQGDDLTLDTATLIGQFADKNVGVNKRVDILGMGLNGADATNYVLANTPITTTADITHATLTYIANTASRTYGTDNPSFTGTVTGFVNGENQSTATTGTLDFNSLATRASNVGRYAIEGFGLSAQNYVFTQDIANIQALTVNPATLTYIADRHKVPQGEIPSEFTGQVTGFVMGDTLQNSTQGKMQFISSANNQSPVGTYKVIGTGLDAQNYIFEQAQSNLTALEIHQKDTVNPPTFTCQELGTCPQPPVIPKPPLEQQLTVSRLDECAVNTEGLPKDCILMPKAEIQVQAATDDDGREAAPIKIKRALIIANSNYQGEHIGKLTGVKNDSVVLSNNLAAQGYHVTVVADADRAGMITAFNQLIRDSEIDDSVLIYYAGHGYVHHNSSVGYWLPVDATYSNQKEWISNVDISRFVRNIAAKQILLVSDSCFSGSLSYETALQAKSELDKNAVLKRRSVMVLTSGSEEPVADKGVTGLSPFAAAFIQGINKVPQGQDLRGQSLYKTVYQQVTSEYKQYPSYGGLASAGHVTGGEYIFEKK